MILSGVGVAGGAIRGHARRSLSVFALGDRIPKIAASAWVAPSASVMGNVSLEADSSVWFGATIRCERFALHFKFSPGLAHHQRR